MRLRVVLPSHIESDEAVRKVTAEAQDGWFCLLPRHVDMTAALVPGLLSYHTECGDEVFVAIEGGTLVKCGNNVLISTPNAVRGAELGELRRAVEQSVQMRDERERNARSALEKIEADFVRRFIELEEHA